MIATKFAAKCWPVTRKDLLDIFFGRLLSFLLWWCKYFWCATRRLNRWAGPGRSAENAAVPSRARAAAAPAAAVGCTWWSPRVPLRSSSGTSCRTWSPAPAAHLVKEIPPPNMAPHPLCVILRGPKPLEAIPRGGGGLLVSEDYDETHLHLQHMSAVRNRGYSEKGARRTHRNVSIGFEQMWFSQTLLLTSIILP